MRDFNHTVNVLVKAYLNGTLFHGSCCACAVGNMVADAIGVEVTSYRAWSNEKIPYWDNVFVTAFGIRQPIERGQYFGEAKRQIDSTGYTVNELAEIEFNFERAKYSSENPDESMFNGLMNVLDVLAEIHGISLEQKAEAKAMFVKENL